MNRRVVELPDGSLSFIEDESGIAIDIEGATEVAIVDDQETWKSIRKSKQQRDKVELVIRKNNT